MESWIVSETVLVTGEEGSEGGMFTRSHMGTDNRKKK